MGISKKEIEKVCEKQEWKFSWPKYEYGNVSLEFLGRQRDSGFGLYTPKIRIHANEHPNCCGQKIIHSISVSDSLKSDLAYLTALKAMIVILRDTKNASALYVASKQNPPALEQALKDAGFQCIQAVKNPKSRNTIRTYIADLQAL